MPNPRLTQPTTDPKKIQRNSHPCSKSKKKVCYINETSPSR